MLAGLILMTLAWSMAAGAADLSQTYPQIKAYFPEADSFGAFEGTPPSAPVKHGKDVIGYVFITKDVVSIPAYSGKPVSMIVGIDKAGVIKGVTVLEQHEPILLVGIPVQALYDFVKQYVGKKVGDRVKVGAGKREGYSNVDAITGATVTVMVVNETIMRAARAIAQAHGIIKAESALTEPPALVRKDVFETADWKTLTGNGAIRRLLVTRGDVDKSFKGTEAETVDAAPVDEKDDTFIDLYYTYLNVPTIGRNLLGESQYNWLMSTLKPGEHAVAIMANGMYSFKGSGYVRGGIFDRIQVTQGGREISFRDLDFNRLSDVYAKGMPEFSEMGIFTIRAANGFDPGKPWRLELLVKRETGPLTSVFESFGGEYQTPEAYIDRPAPKELTPEEHEAMWVQVWRDRTMQIGILGAGLIFLTLVMIFQDWLARYPRLLQYLRNGFLVYTFVFIGWYLLGQLSVVNVLTFVGALMHDFRWDTFLIDPTMFILWSFVAVTLLLWGRGVYCGWLCPFGAIQKLVNELARKLKIRQWQFPDMVHERLWAIKYVILILLFGMSLQSIGAAERYAEVEPFKTAITLHFHREWPFLLYAGGLILISAFNCKFYCKYLCPLGAALAVPARQRLFDWLRRRKECGRPCQICAVECEIQAINDVGEINANECHYCLDCQVTYWNDYKCPPLVEKRKRRERAGTAREKVSGMEKDLGTTAGLDQILVDVPVKPSRHKPDKTV